MKHLKITAMGLVGTTLLSTTAFGAGLDRATFNPDLLFEKGTYGEISFGSTNPAVSPTPAPSAEVAPSFTTVQLGFKHDYSDKFSVALMANNNPFGVHIDYALLGSPTLADLGASSLTLLGKYSFNENISVYGGAQHTKTQGTANLTALGVPEVLTVKGSGTGFILGAAYEIPEIALRASMSYESGADLDPETTGVSGFSYGIGQINAPEAFTFKIQSGVNEKTLVFASVRYAKWEDAQVVLPAILGSTQLSGFENNAAINLGVARRINDNFAMLASLSYEKSGDPFVGPLSPTNGIKGLSVGGRYTNDNGVSTSLGLSYSKRGDAIVDSDGSDSLTAGDIPFSDNKVITIGLKVGKSF